MDPLILLVVIVSILLVAFFAGIEIAFVSANKLNVELKKKQGDKDGTVIARFMEHPEDFIGTSLVGINIALVVYEQFMSQLTKPFLEKLPEAFHNPYLHLILDAIIGTVIILFLGEFLPKAFFRNKAEKILYFFRVPIQFFYALLYPIAKLFVNISEWILKYIFNMEINEKKDVFSRIDLEQFVKQMNTGHDENDVVQLNNADLFENALYLSHVKVRECLIPRKEIEAVDINTDVETVRKKFIETKLSKIIVYENSIDNILGYLHHLDFHRHPKSIKEILHTIITVPEAMSAVDLMNQFTKQRKSIAWVIDEFGGTAGILTMEDVLEEIFGEIKDEHDVEELINNQIAENEYILSGRLELDDLNKKYNFEFSDEEADTLSGFIIANHETIPLANETIIVGDFEFTILSVTDTRIETVKMRYLKDKEN
jgi:putative hemolysin